MGDTDDDPEQWKTCPEFPNYEVSNLGFIRRASSGQGTYSGRVLKRRILPNGSLYVGLYNPAGVSHRRFVDQVVINTFRGPTPKGLVVIHKDGQRTNCSLPNLDFGPSSATVRSREPGALPRPEYTPQQVANFLLRHDRGASVLRLANEEGVPYSHMYDIVRRALRTRRRDP